MLAIIQETLKKINSKITFTHILSLLITLLLIICFYYYISFKDRQNNKPLIYRELGGNSSLINNEKSTIFASKNGMTYTFSWCQGANKIKEENKIYFNNEEEAIKSGKRLSKMCGK